MGFIAVFRWLVGWSRRVPQGPPAQTGSLEPFRRKGLTRGVLLQQRAPEGLGYCDQPVVLGRSRQMISAATMDRIAAASAAGFRSER